MGTINPTLDHDGRLATPNAQRLLSDKTGIISQVYQGRLDAKDDPEIFFTHAKEANLDSLAGRTIDEFDAGGKELAAQDSVLAALGEGVERYCFYIPDDHVDTTATYDELVESGKRPIEYEYLHFLEDHQYDLSELSGEPFRRDSALGWAAGTDLLTGESVYMPSQLLARTDVTDHPVYFTATSNGMATGNSLRMALEGGIVELVERDGFMKAWCTQSSPKRIDLRNFPEVRELKETNFESATYDFHLLKYDNPTDIASIGCAVVNQYDEEPKFLLVGSAGMSLKDTMIDALIEGAQAWHSRISANLSDEDSKGQDEIEKLDQGVAYYTKPENFDEVSFLLDGDTVVPEPRDQSRAGLETLLAELDAAGLTPIAFDLTRPDVREIGWRVTKVFIPEFVGLSLPAVLPRDHPAFDGIDVTDKPHPYP